jgi:hypothetical protein
MNKIKLHWQESCFQLSTAVNAPEGSGGPAGLLQRRCVGGDPYGPCGGGIESFSALPGRQFVSKTSRVHAQKRSKSTSTFYFVCGK